MKKLFLLLALAVNASAIMAQKFEGLAPTPPMGWNSWNTFTTNINEKLVMDMADVMVSSGMKDAGYVYLVLDDGWMAMERDSITGNLVPDPSKFPNGIKKVVDYVHSKGLKFGLYNCAGTKTCAGYPGTRGYEYQDAKQYAAWEIDYLKYDWCYTDGINAKEAYSTMSKALKAAKRPIIFSLCEWGTANPWEWAAPVGHLWRTTGDIFNCFDCIKDYGTWKSLGVTAIIDLRKNIRQYAGPDHWNDMDMMEVGHGMSVNEDRAHFTMWCMLASPLIAGNDLRHMTPETISILTNKDVIAVSQDAKGIQGYLEQQVDSVDTWIKPLANNELAVCFMNRASKPVKISYDFTKHPVNDTVAKMVVDFSKQEFSIIDVWNKKPAGTTGKVFETEVQSHDVVLIRLKPAVITPAKNKKRK